MPTNVLPIIVAVPARDRGVGRLGTAQGRDDGTIVAEHASGDPRVDPFPLLGPDAAAKGAPRPR